MVRPCHKTFKKKTYFVLLSKAISTRRQWLVPIILATQEAKIRRTVVQSQPGQIVGKTLSQKYPT
jgi:hypothetical protein